MVPGLAFGERREVPERRRTPVGTMIDPPLIERRRRTERRTGEESTRHRYSLPAPWRDGWLVFECTPTAPAGTRDARRLAPIPSDWFDCPEPRLASLLAEAQPAVATNRLQSRHPR